MEKKNIDADLIQWTSSFLEGRSVSMVIDGHELESHSVLSGVPQGSPVSPILFAIYLSGVFKEVEAKCSVIGISYADDIGWLATGKDVDKITRNLESAAEAAEEWASRNAVEFDLGKTEAILFARQNNKSFKDNVSKHIRIGSARVQFNNKATRWLGIWLDSHLKLREHHNIMLKKARTVLYQTRRLASTQGLSPSHVRKILVATSQTIALYGAELWWRKDRADGRVLQIQKLVNEHARAITGMLRTTPIGPLVREAGLHPASTLLRYRQRKYALRALELPTDHPLAMIIPMDSYSIGQEKTTNLGRTLRDCIHDLTDMSFGAERIPPHSTKPVPHRSVHIEEREKALRTANVYELRPLANDQRLVEVFWTDGAKNREGDTGAATAWRDADGTWKTQGWTLGRNQEAIDAELLAIAETLKTTSANASQLDEIRIFTDSKFALERIKSLDQGPGQELADEIRRCYAALNHRGVDVHLHWVPGHQDIVGNEVADKAAKEAATRNQNVRGIRKPSLAHISRLTNEARHLEEKQWFGEKCQKYYPQRYKLRKSTKVDPTAAKARKKVALQYYRFAADRAVTAVYLKSIGKRDSDECWWCDRPRQTRDHLFKECRTWRREQEGLWNTLRKEGFMKTHALSTIFAEPRATQAILKFIEETLVGRPKSEDEDRAEEDRVHEEWGWEEEYGVEEDMST